MTTTLTVQQRFEKLALWNTVGFQFISAKDGHAELHIPFNSALSNTGGTLHGGIIMMSLDNVMGMATMSLGFDNVLTIQMETRFVRQGTDGVLVATAHVIERTRSTMIVEGKLHNQEGELVAMCTATFKGIVHA